MKIKHYFYYLLSLFLVLAPTQLVAMEGVKNGIPGFFADNAAIRAAQDLAREMAREVERAAEAKRHKAEQLEREYRDLLRTDGIAQPTHPQHARYLHLKSQFDKAEKQAEQWENVGQDAMRGVMGMGQNWFQAEMDKGRVAAEHKTKVEAAAGAAFAQQLAANKDNEQARQMWTDPKNIALWSIALIGIPVTIYGCKLGLDYAQSKWGKPTLVRESSRQTLMQSICLYCAERFLGRKPVPANLEDIVLAPDIDKRAKAIAEKTRKKQEHNAPYQNLLLYGPPGTGKTAFAKILARYSGMDYALLTGGDIAQFATGEAITEVHKLFDWAEQSSRGLLIFIDEADAFAYDRTKMSADALKVLNSFIARCGDSSKQFMLVFATNHQDSLDNAVRSRIGEHIHFDLPNVQERLKILKKKLEKHIDAFEVQDPKTKKISRLSCDASLTDDFLAQQAILMKDFSGRDIDLSVISMQSEVLETDDHVLTKDIIENVIKVWIEKVQNDKLITQKQRK